METHRRFMNFPTTGLNILEMIGVISGGKSLIVRDIIKMYNDKLFDDNVDLETLKTFRTILCHEYHSLTMNLPIKNDSPNGNQYFNMDLKKIFPENMEHRSIEEFFLLYDIFVLRSALHSNSERLTEAFEKFCDDCQLSSSARMTDLTMKVCECFVDCYNLQNYLYDTKMTLSQVEDRSARILSIVRLWTQRDEATSWRALASLLPKSIEAFGLEKIVSPLWRLIVESPIVLAESFEDAADIDDKLDALCVMADVCFPTEEDRFEEFLYEQCVQYEFWSILNRGMSSDVYQRRKRALYLIKRAMEFTDAFESRTKKNKFMEVEASEINLARSPRSFAMPFASYLDRSQQSLSDEMKKAFILILEALEEKQKHLVLPTLSHLPRLAKLCHVDESRSLRFNPVWLRCVLRRIVRHDNDSIKLLGLRQIVKCDNFIFLDDEFFLFFVQALNNNFSYRIEGSDDQPELVNLLVERVRTWESEETNLINKFVRALASVSWNLDAIYWILVALAEVSKRCVTVVNNLWNGDELCCVENLIRKSLIDRGSRMQKHLHALIVHIVIAYTAQVDYTNYDCLFGIFCSFPQSRYDDLNFKSKIIEHVTRLIGSTNSRRYVIEKCKKLLTTDENLQTFASTLQLMSDSKLVFASNRCPAREAIKNLFENLIGADARPYVDQIVISKIFQLADCLLSLDLSRSSNKYFVDAIIPYANDIVKIVNRSLEKKQIANYDKYLSIVRGMTNFFESSSNHWIESLKQFYTKCIGIISNSLNYSRDQWLYAVKMLCFCNSKIFHDNSKSSLENWEILVIDYFVNHVINHEREIRVALRSTDPSGKFFCDCSEAVINVMFLSSKKTFDEISFRALEGVLENGDERVVHDATRVLQRLLHGPLNVEYVDALIDLMKTLWRIVIRLPKTSIFSSALSSFVVLIIDEKCLELDEVREFATECFEQILREGERGHAIRDEILTMLYNFGDKKKFLCCKAYTHWLLHVDESRDKKRELALLRHGSRFINDQSDCSSLTNSDGNKKIHTVESSDVKTNENSIDDEIVRESKKRFLRSKEGLSDCDEIIIGKLLEILQTNKNKRYFDNSNLHRLKNRVMQHLLLIEPKLNDENAKRIHDTLCEILLAESNQPSVRLMHEWLLIRLHLNNVELREGIWKIFETAAEKRPGCIVSLASIVLHVAKKLCGQIQMNYIEKAITVLLPNCMCQQFNVRLYSQTILVELYRMLPDDSPQAKTHMETFVGVEESLRRGNLTKNSKIILEDFYFNIFDPDLDYNSETIYRVLPRLTNATVDEWITMETLESTFASHIDKPSRRKLRLAKPFSQSCKATGDLAESEASSCENGPRDIQKKITPWKTMISSWDELSEISGFNENRKNVKNNDEGIVVVASLIDRPPNLGGLARSCEIFGANELVIGSLRFVENHEFKTLSMSADKWITITEVKPHLLGNYLLEKKSEGWKLIGAEQTANSKNLIEMIFPKKTILVLGNERDGIPANLIPLLDSCVEIPQNGVVRSLNVHVTGAICMWQYAKQHIFSSNAIHHLNDSLSKIVMNDS